MEKLKGVLLDVKNQELKVVELNIDRKDSSYLDEFYKLLECDLFDIAVRKFDGECLDIFVDDEGLFKEDKIPSVATFNGEEIVEVIYNNVLIFSNDGMGNTISLTDEQIEKVMNCQIISVDESLEVGELYKMLLVSI